MHYYQFNIADYRKDTAHLTLIEHAIYRSLLDTYYMSEKPLTADIKALMRSHCVRSQDERESLENVLNDFFELTENGYFHKKCEENLTKIYKKSEKARESAKARWNKEKELKEQEDIKKGVLSADECEIVANASNDDANAVREKCEVNANGMLPINPIPNNPIIKTSSSKPEVPTCPHEKIISLYHEKLPELSRVSIERWPGSDREKHLRARWREAKKHQSLDFWNWFFEGVRVAKNGFYLGNNNRTWKADLGWMVKRTNFDKLIDAVVDARSQR